MIMKTNYNKKNTSRPPSSPPPSNATPTNNDGNSDGEFKSPQRRSSVLGCRLSSLLGLMFAVAAANMGIGMLSLPKHSSHGSSTDTSRKLDLPLIPVEVGHDFGNDSGKQKHNNTGALVCLCMTSVQHRSKMMVQSLMSVLPQVDRAFLVLSSDYVLPGDFFAAISSDCSSSSEAKNKLDILRVPENQGSGTRFHCLDRIPPESDSFVVTLDDDIIVGDDYVSQMRALLEQWDRLPMIGLHGSFLTIRKGETAKTYRHGNFHHFLNSSSLRGELNGLDRHYKTARHHAGRSNVHFKRTRFDRHHKTQQRAGASNIHFERGLEKPYVVDILGTGIMMFHRSVAKDLSHKLFTREHLQSMSDPWMAVYAKERCIPLICPPRRGLLARQQKESDEGKEKSIFGQLKKNDTRQSSLIASTKGWFSSMGVKDFMHSPEEYISWCTAIKKEDPSIQSRITFLK